MSVPPSIAHYRITSKLGEGGMGEVYRATDTKLNRDVAIKVIPEAFAQDTDRMARFAREAQVLAALNHPNIGAIHGVEERALVLELVEGPTLAERTAKGPLSVEEALAIARQIAEAVEYAHERGVIHRDLKPANIKLTPQGRVKVLDFGLAKLTDKGEEGSTALTQTMAIAGTPGYLAPEQLRGKPADARSDIFAFGCVLYELLSGQRAFPGSTLAASLASTAMAEPKQIEGLPGDLEKLLRRCLRKDPARRIQHMDDVRVALEDLKEDSEPGGVSAAPAPRTARSGRRPGVHAAWTAVAAACAAAIALAAGHFLWRAPALPAWSGIPLGGPDVALTPRLSPDGRTLAFLAIVGRQTEVGVMKPDAGDWSVLTRHEERGSVTTVSWSPDGDKIYYDRILDVPRGVYSIPVLGGEEQLVLEDAMNPEALPDGSLIVARLNAEHQEQLFHYWPGSERLQPLPLQIALSLFLPQVHAFPDSRQAVVIGSPISRAMEGAKDLYVLDLASGRTKLVVSRSNPDQIRGQAVTRDGNSILFAEQGPYQVAELPRNGGSGPRVLFPLTSMAWAIDTGQDGTLYLDQVNRSTSLLRFSLKGGHAVELARVPSMGSTTQFAVLPDGRVVWAQQVAGRYRLVIVEEGKPPVPFSGTAEETTFPVAVIGPKEIAFAIGRFGRTIGIASIATGRITRRIAFDKDSVVAMVSAPDGRVLYCNAGHAIWAQPVSGGAPTRLRAGAVVAMDPAGKYMVVMDVEEGRTRLLKVPLGKGPEQEIRISGEARPYIGATGAISKDGKLLIGLQPPDSWFLDPAVVDLATGRATRIPIDAVGDNFRMAWAPDGEVLAAVTGLQSSLWKFQREER